MCDCIREMNEALIEKNTRIVVPISFSITDGLAALPPIIATEKYDVNDRRKPIKLMASYCPFCGEKIKEG